MNLEVIEDGSFKYLESGGDGENLLLLHGLFGALSNFGDLIGAFGDRYNVVVPILPIYDLPIHKVSLGGLLDYVDKFVEHKVYPKVHVLGNSLGGHIALLYTLRRPERVHTMTLTGSSGLFENAMGSTFPKRGNYEFIKKKTEDTFYDPKTASKELVDEVYGIVNDRGRAIRIIATAKSAIRHNVSDKLHLIKAHTLLVWGKQDIVTPPFVAEKFDELIENTELHFLDKCGHAPMMEIPGAFNDILGQFLSKHPIGNPQVAG